MRAKFIEEAICQKQAHLLSTGALAVQTGRHTGRSANSRFIVRDQQTEGIVDWGDVNKPFDLEKSREFFRAIQKRLASDRVFEVRGHIGPFPLEVVSASCWHAAFAENMFRNSFIETLAAQASRSQEGFGTIRIWHDPYTPASHYGIAAPEDAFILLDPTNFSVGIVGTAYAGEIKKSAFSLANHLLPASGILPMHSSANCREDGTGACVIFGLSGTGKTTLSAQAGRFLIGDDEIVWSDRGISNLEGGCYAKLIHLSRETEPDIFRAVSQYGAILENVVFDESTRLPNFDDDSRTENTRGSYRLEALDRVFDQAREASHPETIVFLTADAFGALPAVARLDEWQMRYHFMSGFTAKVAGTEMGLKEPKAAFSACFGAPFMPRSPSVYANLLAEKVKKSGARVWLLNTGWRGGYQNGKRFPIPVTRRLLEMIQTGELDESRFERHPIFGFEVPVAAKGIDAELLSIPEGPQVEDLARRFIQNQEKFRDQDALEIIERGGPSLKDGSGAGRVAGWSKSKSADVTASR
jgi:phosphoenolpyruvate carboxykinase (ATP)